MQKFKEKLSKLSKLLKQNKRINIPLKIYILLAVIICFIVGITFTFSYFSDKKLEKEAKNTTNQINQLIGKKLGKKECKILDSFDEKKLRKNKHLNFAVLFQLENLKSSCKKLFSITNIYLDEKTCSKLIYSTPEDYSDKYLYLDAYNYQKTKCIEKYLKTQIKSDKFFDLKNKMKSSIRFDFPTPFYNDLKNTESTEFLQNRINAKKQLLGLIDITPKVPYTIDDLTLHPKTSTLYLNFQPKTKYTITLKSFKNEVGNTKEFKLNIETPENKYLGISMDNPVSLYQDTRSPTFTLSEYNSGITSTNIKICRIDNETYSKIELLRAENDKDLITAIDTLKTKECNTKTLTIKKNENGKVKLNIFDFNFDKEIGKPARSGLYYVTFEDKKHRNINNIMQYPYFFGIVDSHITAKISKEEAYFFVNNFDGKPLAGQKIRAYINTFTAKDNKWNREKQDYDTIIYSPLLKNIYSKEILLGSTDKNGELKIKNLNEKINNAFGRTFSHNSYEYEWSGESNNFFITSSSKTNLTYLNSTWNAGIAPWNFGYKIYGRDGIILDRHSKIPDYYSHIYTDRVLYLPGEEVNIKAIIRNALDLSPPTGKEFELNIFDSKNKEIFNKKLTANEFGSVYDKIKIPTNAPLGSYSINLNSGDKKIYTSTFSVEVFKNPKFKTEINLTTTGLNGDIVKITNSQKKDNRNTTHTGNFTIKADVFSDYYNGAVMKNAKYTYKIFKQTYWDNEWWNDCYYGCYWEPNKEFYTSGEGVLDNTGKGKINIDIDFRSSYNDYKYLVEVTVEDEAGDKISSSNSVIAKLPKTLKGWYSESFLTLNTDKKFNKLGENILIKGELNGGTWSKQYDNKYILFIKKKNYKTTYKNDVKGYVRPITNSEEKIVKTILINSKNFVFSPNKKTFTYNFKPKETGEYIFEYGKIANDFIELGNKKFTELVAKQNETGKIEFTITSDKYTDLQLKDNENLIQEKIEKKYNFNNFLSYYDKKYFNNLVYGNLNAKNPIVDDNKIQVLTDKVSYKIGEKAKLLIMLPFSKGKILLTKEKKGVVKSELINVNSNTFFHEITVDKSFAPNSYIGVVAIDTSGEKIPEYKVGYTEIVIDKTDRKADITVSTNKKEYKPREEVTLNIQVKNDKKIGLKSEVSLMVVDDSLISLMGNVDLNMIDKFFRKLPFQIQTSITNLAMIRNYYFSRPGIVGGSGFGNFKGGDSAVSSRNIFKNTAYYNPSIITDKNGKAQVKFTLPDNLTNFRIITVSNSLDNHFGVSQDYISVRQNVILEDKTPLMLRIGDKLEMGANLFNTTKKDIGIKVRLESKDIEIFQKEQNITLKAGTQKYVKWSVKLNKNIDKIKYTIKALGNSAENSDKIENIIAVKSSPVLITNKQVSKALKENSKSKIELNLDPNTDISKTKVELILSNSRLNGIEKIISSLAVYPHGCIEQTTSSTLPNAILKKFNSIFSGIADNAQIDKNIKAGVDRIFGMQVADGGFAYWPGKTKSNLHITPYVLRSLIDMKNAGVQIPQDKLTRVKNFLISNYEKANIADKSEILWALAKVGIDKKASLDISKENRHTLIAYTYYQILTNKEKSQIDKNIELIKSKAKKNSGYYYRNSTGDKAIFVSMLMDYGYSFEYIDKLIKELYGNDWSSYYYSTQSKNNSFIAFVKYLKKYGKSNKTSLKYGFGNNVNNFVNIGGNNNAFIKKEFNLSDIVSGNKIILNLEKTDGNLAFVDLILKQYPIDKTKIKASSNGINITRSIYEVISEDELVKCNSNYRTKTCPLGLKLHTTDTFVKGKLYKINLNVYLSGKSEVKNLSIEDYLPAGFKVINSKFKTESSVLREEDNPRTWDHKEFKADEVFINAGYYDPDWDGEFGYFIRAENPGTFTYPPVTGYLMYDPAIKSNTTYKIIKIK